MQGQPTTAADKALILAAIEQLVNEGMPLRKACIEVGVEHWGKPLNHNNYYRWKQEAAGLKEARPEGRKGRPVKFDLTQDEARRLRFWAMVKDSIPLAVEAFIAEAMPHDDGHPYFVALREALMMHPDNGSRARPELASALRLHWEAAVNQGRAVKWPQSILRACHVTKAERASFRGKKASSGQVGTERRGGFIIAEDGTKLPWAAGMIWESDDMSCNEPFRFYDEASKREMTGRQMLATIDAYSLYWLGHSMIGRDRDSYRAEDIATHFRDMVDMHGLPLIWRIEKGRWDNNFIWGICIGRNEDGTEKRWGGLNEIIHIRSKHESRGKANVEGSFDLLQSLIAHGFNGSTQSIGRVRGEFESETRSMLRANRNNADAADLSKFWDVSQASDAMARAMHLFNSRPKTRHNFDNKLIVPAQLWAEQVKRPLPGEHRWRFCAIKAKATVNKGIITVRAPHYPQSFRFRLEGGHRTPGIMLDSGHDVLIAFTPSEAWMGCHVFNADMTSRNREGYGFGELIGVAEWMMDAPQEDLAGHSHSSGQKRQAAAVRKETRALLAGTHFIGRRIRHAQDSFGNVKSAASALGTPNNPHAHERAHGADAGAADPARKALSAEELQGRRDTYRNSGVTDGETSPAFPSRRSFLDDDLEGTPPTRLPQRQNRQRLTLIDLDEEEERRAMAL